MAGECHTRRHGRAEGIELSSIFHRVRSGRGAAAVIVETCSGQTFEPGDPMHLGIAGDAPPSG
jgi:hypothetical protein